MSITISIIIPVYNNPQGLKDTISSLVIQNYPFDKYEVIIADNGSIDNTKDIAKEYAGEYPQLVKYVVEDKIQSSYAARNKGIKAAKGNLICFLDANVTVETDFLSKAILWFQRNKVDYLGCNVKMKMIYKTLTSKYNYLFGFDIQTAIKDHKYTPTCCLIIRQTVIEKVGNFDSRLEGGGDFEFGERVSEADFCMDYAKDIIVYHPTRWKYLSLINKSKRVCRGNAELAYYYPNKYKYLFSRHFIIKNFLPRNPIKFYRVLNDKGIQVSMLTTLLFPFYHIPIQLAGTIAAIKRAKVLRETGK